VTRLRCVHAFVVAGLMAGSSCAPKEPGDGPGKKDRAIYVHLVDEDGKCTPHMGELSVQVYLGDDVVWDVENDCAGGQEVAFVDFKEKQRGTAKDPFGSGERKGRVGAKETGNPQSHKNQLRASLRDDDAYKGTYKYTVRITNGNELDPELEVDGKKRGP
jgi:hypothetical protein